MISVAVLCNWWNHPELIEDFCDAVEGEAWDGLIVMDNASDKQTTRLLDEKIAGVGGRVIQLTVNSQLEAFRQSAEATDAVILAFVNNDIQKVRPGWVTRLTEQVQVGVMCGQEIRLQMDIHYLDGWCLAIHRQDWEQLGGYDMGYEEPPYWADVDLSWRAAQYGLELRAVDVGLHHLTSTSIQSFRREPWFREVFQRNRQRLALKLANEDSGSKASVTGRTTDG